MKSPLIDKYTHSHLGELIVMMSLDGVQPLLPVAGLALDDQKAFQAVCHAVTDRCPEAEYDEDAEGWNRWYGAVAHEFRSQTLPELSDVDRRRVLFWLENGTPPDAHTFPHRALWRDAIAWIANRETIAELVDGDTLNKLKDFAVSVKEARLSEDYAEAVKALSNGPETFADTLQKTKFHINIVPDAIVSQHLITLKYMRNSHILRRNTEDFIAKGGDIAILENAVRLYADTEVTSKWLSGYVADRDGFAFDGLWSNTYREGLI